MEQSVANLVDMRDVSLFRDVSFAPVYSAQTDEHVISVRGVVH